MGKSSHTGAVGAPRHARGEQSRLRYLLQIFGGNPAGRACDAWPALLLPELRQERQLELEWRNEELRQARAELISARGELWDLYERAPVGYVTVDADGRVLAANLRFNGLLGRAWKDIVGHDLNEFIHPEDQACYQRQRRAFHDGAQRAGCELRICRADGVSVWTGLESVVVTGEGAGQQVRSAVSDITEQRRSEAERAGMRECMLQSQKLETVGALAAGLAHDINNVLGMVLLFGSSLERRLSSGDPGKQDAADIVAAALHGKQLTQDLLNFAHKSPRHKELYRPSEIITRLVMLLQRTVAKRIAIKPLVDDAVAAIEGDSAQFMQMLMNLCLNAVDAIPDQGTITIAASNVGPGDAELQALVGRTSIPYVRIEIADDGVGMDAETRQHAFEPFFTTKELGKGTGLGLFMVYGEVQDLHGAVRIDSQLNQGTSVHILLPAPWQNQPRP